MGAKFDNKGKTLELDEMIEMFHNLDYGGSYTTTCVC